MDRSKRRASAARKDLRSELFSIPSTGPSAMGPHWPSCGRLRTPCAITRAPSGRSRWRRPQMRDFRLGIEEEYFVVDRRTARVKPQLSQPFMKAAKKRLGPCLMYELLQSQIEVATTPITRSDDARQQLKYFRSTLAELGRDYNIGIVAAGTHPLALPHRQQMTAKRRYVKVAKDL